MKLPVLMAGTALLTCFAAGPLQAQQVLDVSLRFESLGFNTLGVDLDWRLPGLEFLTLQAGYASSRPLGIFAPGLLPVDYGRLGLNWHFAPDQAIDPFAGLNLRLAGASLDTIAFPQLAELPASAFSAGLSGGCRFRISEAFSAFAEIGLNYPASLFLPYLSWSLGTSYRFGLPW